MNALLAGLFVTSSVLFLAYGAASGKVRWNGSKIGLVLYALGTFFWSLKGIQLNDPALILISALQTVAVLIGVLL